MRTSAAELWCHIKNSTAVVQICSNGCQFSLGALPVIHARCCSNIHLSSRTGLFSLRLPHSQLGHRHKPIRRRVFAHSSFPSFDTRMVGLDVLTTLVVAAKTLYEISQEAKESHEECEAIHSTVAALAKTLGESLSAVENATVSMQNRLAEITKYVPGQGSHCDDSFSVDRTIQEITRSMNILIQKPFLYKVIHRRSVKSKLKKARTSLYDATNVFQVCMAVRHICVQRGLKHIIGWSTGRSLSCCPASENTDAEHRRCKAEGRGEDRHRVHKSHGGFGG